MRVVLAALSALAIGANAYSHNEGLYVMQYAHVAYCTAAKIQSWSCQTCRGVRGFTVESVVTDSSTYGQAFVGYNSQINEIVVSFRGTVSSSIKNWIADLSATRTRWSSACSGCMVHSGFKNSYNKLAPGVRAAVSRLLSRHRSAFITITGHSLGAAMAGVCAMDLKLTLGVTARRVITFGQPRTGDSDFANAVHRIVPSYARVVHHKDIVPHVPTTWLGYTHLATEIYYSSDTSYRTCNGSGEDSSCSDQFSAPWHWSVSDHLTYLGRPMGSASCS